MYVRTAPPKALPEGVSKLCENFAPSRSLWHVPSQTYEICRFYNAPIDEAIEFLNTFTLSLLNWLNWIVNYSKETIHVRLFKNSIPQSHWKEPKILESARERGVIDMKVTRMCCGCGWVFFPKLFYNAWFIFKKYLVQGIFTILEKKIRNNFCFFKFLWKFLCYLVIFSKTKSFFK